MMNIQKRRRRDGSKAYRVRISDATGKTLESATFGSLREARTWGREREQLIYRAGGSQRYARSKIPLRKACDRYIREVTTHKKGAIKERQRFAVLFAACSNDVDLTTALRLALETGMRRGELIRMTWDCVDLKKRIIRLPDSKTGVPRNIPLSTAAKQALAAIPRRIDGSSAMRPVTR